MAHPTWSSWTVDPLVIALVVAAAWLYATAYRRAARHAGNRRPGVGRWLPYSLGLTLIAVALMSPLDGIGDGYLLSAHMLQHILLQDVAPALIVLGLRAPILPLGLGKWGLRQVAPGGRLGRLIAFVTSPWVALPALGARHLGVVDSVDLRLLRGTSGRACARARHALLHRPRDVVADHRSAALRAARAGPRRLAYLGFTRLASAFVCVPLTWLSHPEYSRYVAAPHVYGISAITDQHLAGAGMCFLEFLILGIAMGRDLPQLPCPRREARGRAGSHRR